MLDILRKKASSWMVKVILGLIALVFIFFFGSSSLRDPQKKSATVATVNDYVISEQMVEGLLRLQKDSNPAYNNLPESFEAQLKQSIVASLIESEVIRHSAQHLGLLVTDQELSATIKSNPNLSKDGVFNSDFYQYRFLPRYREHYNIDYESLVRDSILQEKYQKLFDQPLFVADELVKNQYELENTKIKLQQIIITPSNDELATQLWPLFTKGNSLKTQIKKHNLVEKETPLTNIANAYSLIPGQEDLETIATLFKLTLKSPYPQEPIKTGNSIYLIKLIQKETPSWDEFEKTKEKEKDKIKNQLAQQFYREWYQEEIQKVKIKYNNP